MDSFFKHPIVIAVKDFVLGHPLLWFLLLLFVLFIIFLKFLSDLIPQIQIIKARIIVPFSRLIKHRKLAKIAIKSDVVGHVNRAVATVGKYLPTGWVHRIDIDWVSQETKTDFLENKQVILRIRPTASQEENFVKAVHHCLKISFFPKTEKIIPKAYLEASILHVGDEIAHARSQETVTAFQDHVLEPAILRHEKIPDHLERYREMNKRGLFYGIFLRELHNVAHEVRFTPARGNVGAEAKSIIDHIDSFLSAYKAETDAPPNVWRNSGNVSQYAILLVAHPKKTQSGIDAYIHRVQDHQNNGVKRIYIFGTNQEAKFCQLVVNGITTLVPDARLIEEFETPFDYRGEHGGVGAMFQLTRLGSDAEEDKIEQVA